MEKSGGAHGKEDKMYGGRWRVSHNKKGTLAKPKHGWENNIKTVLCQGVDEFI